MKLYGCFSSTGNQKFGIFIAAVSIGMLSGIQFSLGEDRLTGFPFLVLSGQTVIAPLHQFKTPFDNLITIGTLKISLEKTALDDIHSVVGGTLKSRKSPGASTSWLCYELTTDNLKRRIWFVSERTSTDLDVVNLISTELINDHTSGCDTPKFDLTSIVLPIPTLKDNTQALRKRFGTVPKGGLVRYANEQKQQNGQITVQSLVYRVQDGKIDGIAFSQATAPR